MAVDTDAKAEVLIQGLRTEGYEIGALVEPESVRRIATIRLVTRSNGAEGVVLDLLFASSGIEVEIVAMRSCSKS